MSNILGMRKNVNDGYFELDYSVDGIYITVFPAIGSGKKLDINDVVKRLARKRIKNYLKLVVDSEIKRPSKKKVKIADPQEEVLIDGIVEISVTADKMKAYITFIEPDGGKPIAMTKVLEELAENGVVYGINNDLLESLLKYPSYNEKLLIAEGKTPINGKSGQIECFFDVKKESKPTILEDGRVDYRDLDIIKNATTGQKLCALVPPIKGLSGKMVTGNEIKAIDGKEAKLPKGRNVEISEDEKTLVAQIDGEICFLEGKVNVYPNYEVPSDVGPSTGNVKFIGNVSVRGNVMSGYEIEAGGNVEVFGVVEGAVIKAKGDIVLRRGMQGNDKGVLICGGEVIARYIENSVVHAGNSIKSEAIMHSNIKCGNSVELSGKKGLLVGGKCKVGKEVSAKVIGSHMNTVTELEVGSNPSLKEKYIKLKDELNKVNKDNTKTDQAIILLQRMKKSGSIDSKKEELLARSLRTIVHLKERIEKINSEMEKINKKLNEETKGKIHISGNIYQGTRITIGTSTMNIKDTLQKCTLYKDGDIRIGTYEK
ncbi:MAG: FapA family protein [Clostridiales bacterium]